MLYFKNSKHKEDCLKLMRLFGFQRIEDDREYGVFCYLVSATYKYNDKKNNR